MRTITHVELTCVVCGTSYQMDETLNGLRKNDGKSFYCPNGHGQGFTHSTVSKLEDAQKELREVKAELEDAQRMIRHLKCALLRQSEQGTKKSLLQQLGLKQ